MTRKIKPSNVNVSILEKFTIGVIEMFKNKIKNIAQLALSAALAFGAFSVIAPGSPAEAGDMSAKTHGCYAQWYNTYAKGVCAPATANGRVQLYVNTRLEVDYHGPWKAVVKGKTYNTFDNHQAWYRVNSANVNWRSR